MNILSQSELACQGISGELTFPPRLIHRRLALSEETALRASDRSSIVQGILTNDHFSVMFCFALHIF